MKAFFAGVRRWWLRRFRGVVEPPARNPQGTTWQQYASRVQGFTCACGTVLAFGPADYHIISQDHAEGCEFSIYTGRCDCHVLEARYVKICPQCRCGHWKLAQ